MLFEQYIRRENGCIILITSLCKRRHLCFNFFWRPQHEISREKQLLESDGLILVDIPGGKNQRYLGISIRHAVFAKLQKQSIKDNCSLEMLRLESVINPLAAGDSPTDE
jgi:hypothetical protein